MKCGCCGKTGLKKTVLAAVIEKGRMIGRRVGDCCARDGILIVTSKMAPVVQVNERKDQKETLEPFIRTLEGQLKMKKVHKPSDNESNQLSEWEGITSTLENVVAMLKSGRA